MFQYAAVASTAIGEEPAGYSKDDVLLSGRSFGSRSFRQMLTLYSRFSLCELLFLIRGRGFCGEDEFITESPRKSIAKNKSIVFGKNQRIPLTHVSA